MQKFINKLVKNSDIRHFLSATFETNSANGNYSGSLTQEIFYKELYYNSNKADKLIDEIKNLFNNDLINTLFLTGYRGIGKTTFVNYAKQNLQNDFTVFLIKFEVNSSKTELDRIKDMVIKEFSINIINKKRRINCLDKFIKLYKETIEYITWYSNETNNFIESLQDLSEFLKVGMNDYEIRKFLLESMWPMNVNELLSMFILWISSSGSKTQKIIFIFDNLDVIEQPRTYTQFFDQFILFSNNYADFNNSIQRNGKYSSRFLPFFERMLFIYVLRDTSYNCLSTMKHFDEPTRINAKKKDLALIYDKTCILEKRIGFLKEKNLFRENKEIYSIYNMMQDTKIYEVVFSMFNQNYRNLVTILYDIAREKSDYVRQYQDIKDNLSNQFYDQFIFGSRGIIFFCLLEKFYSKGLFAMYKIPELKLDSGENAVSYMRIILLILLSRDPEYCDEICSMIEAKQNYIEVYELYTKIKSLIPQANDFATLIINMFKYTEFEWGHFINIESNVEIDAATLTQHINAINNGECSNNKILIHITCSGRNYIRFVCTHFEFFSVRCGHKQPLFMCSVEDNDYMEIINNVFEKVEKCKNNIKIIVQNNLLAPENTYLSSEFVYKKRSNNYKGVMHYERLVFSHISYLDAFRIYFTTKLNGKRRQIEEINKNIINKIQDYINLIDDDEMATDYSKLLINDFKEVIEKINRSNNYLYPISAKYTRQSSF